jgi:hypothetical protein
VRKNESRQPVIFRALVPAQRQRHAPIRGTSKTFDEDVYLRALQDWAWLPIAGKRPVLASLFGDVFLEDAEGIWCLDVLEGSLKRVVADRQQMTQTLATEQGQDDYLLAGLAVGAHHRLGLSPGPAEVLAWRIPPVLGGPIEAENLELMDFEVHMSIQAQLHQQVSALKPGTKIAGFSIDAPAAEPSPPKKGWFRRR